MLKPDNLLAEIDFSHMLASPLPLVQKFKLSPHRESIVE
jgi:hypothetical protein